MILLVYLPSCFLCWFHILQCTHCVAFCCISFKSLSFLFSHGCLHMGQMDLFSSIFVRFFPKLSRKHFIDHTLQMYRLISPHCLCILPWFSNIGDTQINMYIHVPFGHAVFIKKHFGKSSVISDQATMYMCSLVSVFYSRFSSVKQPTFEIYIILSKFYLGFWK